MDDLDEKVSKYGMEVPLTSLTAITTVIYLATHAHKTHGVCFVLKIIHLFRKRMIDKAEAVGKWT